MVNRTSQISEGGTVENPDGGKDINRREFFRGTFAVTTAAILGISGAGEKVLADEVQVVVKDSGVDGGTTSSIEKRNKFDISPALTQDQISGIMQELVTENHYVKQKYPNKIQLKAIQKILEEGRSIDSTVAFQLITFAPNSVGKIQHLGDTIAKFGDGFSECVALTRELVNLKDTKRDLGKIQENIAKITSYLQSI